jgi:mono/diheme cytochrome c family protein
MRSLLAALGVILMGVGLSVSAQPPPVAAKASADAPQTPKAASSVDFARDILPILEANCVECHGPKKSRGRLRLDVKASAFKGGNTGPALVANDSERSLMVRRVLGLDGEDRMPLDEDPLPDSQIALLKAWIDRGAEWPDDGSMTSARDESPSHWAYRVPERPRIPHVAQTAWVRTPIDAFILARLEKEGLHPAKEAGKEALLRRVSLDLIGLPPTPAEIDAFLSDSQPDAYERVVDRLLASPHYGERWARPWLDLARYADSNGYEKDALRTMWKYRDWVINALNEDMPFDRFTIEQLAGDMLPKASNDQRIASGFHRNTQLNQEGGIDVEEARWEALLDRVNTTATVWLGSTIACAQCHNHKYDPFSQRDYYRLLAFFDNVEYSVFGQPGSDHWIQEPTLDLPSPDQTARRDALTAELARLNATLKAPGAEIDAGQPSWEAAQQAATSAWSVLTPSAAKAGSATLTTRPDGSVLASGLHVGVDRYEIDVTLPAGRVTALRLEALPDPSLPKGGPGRDHYGNFVLSGFAADRLGEAGDATPLTFNDVKTDDGSAADVKTLIQLTPRRYLQEDLTGWNIDATKDETRVPRQLVFVCGQPLELDAATRLRVTLSFDSGNVGQAIGRFRLSATSNQAPLDVVAVRARTRPLLAIAPGSRTPDQIKIVQAEYRGQAVALKPTRDRIAEIGTALRELGIVAALVMQERAGYERPSTPFRERGAFLTPGERVYAATPEILPPMGADQMPNRLGLAQWLVSPDNPLTARVTVNRAWEQFFGRGLVETSEDFGTQGAAPSHPELLDYLATEFVKLGWKQKALHRLIVTSAAYRQDAAATPALVEKDPYNRLIARGPRFRMEAEMMRDVALATSGLLSAKIGGPSVFPVQPEGIWDNPYSDEVWKTSEGEDRHRRGIYTFIRRTSPYPSFMTFDATSREFCTVRRVRTNTPLQALTGLNDEAFFEAARALALKVAAPGPASTRRRASEAFRLVTGRHPTEQEIDAVVASYKRQLARYRVTPAEAAKVMKASAPSPQLSDQAAWTLVANALLNLDEALTK